MSDTNTAYTMEWYIPKRVILIQYQENFTAETMEMLSVDLERFYQEGVAPIHIISDQSQVGAIKIGLKSAKQGLSLMNQEDWGWIMIMGDNSLISFLTTVITNTFKLQIRNVQSLEEALNTLERIDMSLPDVAESE